MTLTDQVKSTLHAPSPLPLWIESATLTALYTDKAIANGDVSERALTLAEITPEIATLFSAGFLARPIGSVAPVRATSMQSATDSITLQVNGTLHASALTVLTRLMVNLHEVPGNPDPDFDLPPLRYADTIKALHISCTGATNAPNATQTHVLDPISEDPLPRPQVSDDIRAAIAPVMELERLIVSNVPKLPSDIENAFLTLCDSGCFLPLGAVTDHDPGNAELFVANGSLIIDRLAIQPHLLIDFIGLLTDGHPERTAVTSHT